MWYLILKTKRMELQKRTKMYEGCDMAFVQEVTVSVICFSVEKMNKKEPSLTLHNLQEEGQQGRLSHSWFKNPGYKVKLLARFFRMNEKVCFVTQHMIQVWKTLPKVVNQLLKSRKGFREITGKNIYWGLLNTNVCLSMWALAQEV